LGEEERVIQVRVLFKRKRINVEALMSFIGKEFGVTREEIAGGSQRQAANRARSVFCYLGVKELGLTGRELSRALGLTPAAIHYAIVRGENFLKEDKEIEEGLNKYLKNLTTSP
jgi:chromosomal replication initiation ATPase DnaA